MTDFKQATAEEVRQVWLMVALAVARDGLTPPDMLTLDASRSSINLGVPGHAAARAWGEWFDGLRSERYQNHREGTDAAVRVAYYYKVEGPGGWMWNVDGAEPLNPPEPVPSAAEVLAEQVIAAVQSAPIRPPTDEESAEDYAAYLASTRTQAVSA